MKYKSLIVAKLLVNSLSILVVVCFFMEATNKGLRKFIDEITKAESNLLFIAGAGSIFGLFTCLYLLFKVNELIDTDSQ